MYEKIIDMPKGNIELIVKNTIIIMDCNDAWTDNTVNKLSIEDAKRLRNYLTEAINFATLNKEEDR